MRSLLLLSSIVVASISIFYSSTLLQYLTPYLPKSHHNPMSTARANMTKALTHAKIRPRRSTARGHSEYGWLDSYHTFSVATHYDPEFQDFGSLIVLNEDRVAPQTGFPTHRHQNFEIFSYVLSGELTHRDSTVKKGQETNGTSKNDFYRLKRGDVQFTTGGRGVAHSEENEGFSDWVHFLQIWATPWSRGLAPRYHTRTFDEGAKRLGFIHIISPLAAGRGATAEQELAAVPRIENTIPIHADLIMGAAIIPVDKRFAWTIGAGDKVQKTKDRKVYVHLPMTKRGSAKIRLDGREGAVLSEGDGAFVEGVDAGDVLGFESIGEAEAEVVVLDSN